MNADVDGLSRRPQSNHQELFRDVVRATVYITGSIGQD